MKLKTFLSAVGLLISSLVYSQSPAAVAGAPSATAVLTGNWSDANTWGGTVPGTNDRVLIPNGITVTVNSQVATKYKSLAILGKLKFANGTNTRLQCEYIFSGMTGELEVGTSTHPIGPNYTAEIVFAEMGGTDTTFDKERYAPGAVLMGKTTMFGAAKTSWLALQTQPVMGATQLVLESAPSGWQVGDSLVVAGTDLNDYRSDELVRIANISGNIVTLSNPLTRNHTAPAAIQGQVKVHVGNLTRNIIVSSENSSVDAIGSNEYRKPRGHLMFMHTLDVTLKYMSTKNIGRTDKRIELDDWNAIGLPRDPQPLPLIPGGYKNPRGKYSIHFHRGGTSPTLTPALVEACVVNNDPGWGFVNHSSRVNFIRNVSYDVVGSAFCTESGNETGSFIENFACRTYNPDEPMNEGRPNTPFGERTEALADARENLSDFAWQGDGFWFHSTGVTVTGNVVSGCTGHAYVYWSEGLVENNLGLARGNIDIHCPANEFPTLHAELTAWKATYPDWNYDIWYLKSRPFQNNTAYNMCRGVHGYYVMTTFHEVGDYDPAEMNRTPPGYRNKNRLVIENTTLWGMRRVGMGFNHCANIELKNNRVYGHGTSTAIAPWTPAQNQYTPYLEVEPAVLGMDLDHYHNDRNWVLENNTISGFNGNAIGLTLPTNAQVEVNGGTFDNGGTDIKIREVNWRKNWIDTVVDADANPLPQNLAMNWRTINLQGNIQFLNSNRNIVMDPQMNLSNPAQDAFGILIGDRKMSGYFLLREDIRLNFPPFNNTKVYFQHQHPDTIPATTATKHPIGVPTDIALAEVEARHITPDQFLNKTNQVLFTQYGTSFGGELMPSTAVIHPMIINGRIACAPTPPTITSQPSAQAVCLGANATFSVVATGAAGYQWKKDGVNIAGATGASYTITGVAAANAGSYTVAVNSACGSVISNAAALTVNPSTAITTQPQNATICSGSTANLSVVASGNNLTYQWQQGGTNIAGATSATYAATTAGTYSVVVTGTCGNVTSSNAVVTVNPATAITTQPQNATICSGSTANLSVVASGNNLSYQWQQGGTNIAGATSATYAATAAGTYTVVVTGTCGNVTSSNAVVTVNPSTAITTQPQNATICSGSTANLSVVASGNNLSYQWQQGGTNIAGATSATYAATAAGTYSVVVTGACGNVTSSNAVVTVNPATAITTQPQNATICAGSTANLSVVASGNNLSYQWQQGGTNITGATSATYAATAAGTYSVVVTGACGNVTSSNAVVTVNPSTAITTQPQNATICSGSTANLSVVASGNNLSYQWQQGGTNISGATSATYAATAAGTYSVVVTGACGNVTSSNAVVTVNPSTAITTQPQNATICAGSTANLSVVASGNNLSYQWQQGGTNISGATSATYAATAAGTYSVVVTGTCGNVTSSTAVVTVNPSTAITTQPQNATICSGSTANLSVVASGNNLTYQWQQGGTNIAGATSATYAATTAGTYSVVVTGTCGNVTSSNTVVTVNPATAITTQPAANTAICAGANTTLSVVAAGSGLTYQWQQGGTNISGATNASYTANAAGTYSVVVTGACGNVTSSNAVVTVNPSTAITTQPQNATICSGSTANLSVVASGNNLMYQWQQGGTNIAGATSATYAATAAGTYSVVVTGACGNVASSNAVVTVNPATAITTQPQNATICAGSTANLSVVASGNNLSYQWQQGGTNIAGATSATYAATTAGTYSVVVTGTCGNVTSSNAVVTVNPSTAITTQPQNATICAGSTANLSVVGSGNNLSYQWQQGGTNIAGATSATYAATAAGTYSVVVTGTCGNVTSSNAVVTVNPATAITIQPAANTAICAGANTTLSVVAAGSGLTYQWQQGGTNISGATNASYTANAAGTYSVVVTGACGNITSSNAVVTEVSLTAPIVTAGGPTTFCDGGSVNLTSSQSSGNTWSNGGTLQAITVSSEGSYSVTYTDGNGCTSPPSIPIVVDINPLPDNNVTQAVNQLTADQAGATYQWLDCDNGFSAIPGQTNQVFQIPGVGEYAVQLNLGGCIDTSDCIIIGGSQVNEQDGKLPLGVLSLNDLSLSEISIHPNPASDVLFIVGLKNEYAFERIELLSNDGRVVYKSSNIVERIDVSKLAVGNYFLSVYTSIGVRVVQFVKK